MGARGALPIIRAVRGERHPETLAAARRLAQMYEARQMPGSAAPYRELAPPAGGAGRTNR